MTDDTLGATDAERDLRELRDAVLQDWLVVTSRHTTALQQIQQTLSWRVTRPLRRVRLLQKKVDEIGPLAAGQLAAVAVAKRIGRR